MFLSLILSLSICLLLFSLLLRSIPKPSVHHNHSQTSVGLVAFYKHRRRLLHWYTELLSESPSQTIVVNRLGACRTVVTANPENVEYMLKGNFDNYPKGKSFTEICGDFLGLGIFNVDGSMWRAQRKLASHEFSTRSLREFVVKTLEELVENRLLQVLEWSAENDAVFDLQDLLRRLAFDSICKVSLGMDPCCLALDLSRPPPPLVTAFDTASEIIARRGSAPVAAAWKIKRAFNIGSEKKLKEAVKIVHTSVAEIIKRKREKLNQNPESDLLSRLLSAGHDDKTVIDMVISFLMAGRDTTSSALTWLFWLLTWHRDVEKGIIHEIKSLEIEGKKCLEFENLKEMDYLKACLCESMRLYPPVVWDSKHAAGDDVLPDGMRVFAGDRVTYFPYAMGRMERLWGKDRLEYRPDRWLDGAGMVKPVSPFKFPVFQAGPRVCLGKEMAFIQMKFVVASVLRRFEFVPVMSDRPAFVPLLTAYMAGGLKVRVQERVK